MKITDFIKTKQDSKKHTKEEINYFIKNLNQFSQEEITHWLKAVKANGLDDQETSALCTAMTNSGVILNWEGLEPTIDKHSTGGIGDKITLLFAPLMAAYGINVPKLSGRGLGITGGTIDKLESIKGFQTNLTSVQLKDQVKKIGLGITSASHDLAPVEKKLYMIRDVTDTIDSIPLIASSIMAKKFAGGSKNIILDVKFGSGAFMKSFEEARLLAQTMVNIGKANGKKIKAVLSIMDQPLGYAIGNVLEVKEVMEILSGKEVDDLVEITIKLALEVISMVNTNVGAYHGTPLQEKLRHCLLRGEALRKFEEMVKAQGGNLDLIYDKKEKANHIEVIKSNQDGYIHNIDALAFGESVHYLGAGRKSIQDKIDYSVGIVSHKKYGDKVVKNESLFEIHSKSPEDALKIKSKLTNAIKFGQDKPSKLKLVYGVIK